MVNDCIYLHLLFVLMFAFKEWMTRFKKNKNEQKEQEVNDENEETRLLIHEDENDEEEEVFPDNFARPSRSHHCYELEANVLRMDHYCVWFNNAVGFLNYKYFILTIIYLFMSCLMSIYILIYRLFINNYVKMEYGILNVLCLLLTLIVCLFFIAFSGMHSFQHLWQMSKNLTSIEYHKVKLCCAIFKVFIVCGVYSLCNSNRWRDILKLIFQTLTNMITDGTQTVNI